MISNAVPAERRSMANGWEAKKGNFSETTANLPQKIVLFGEANTDKQGGLDVTPFIATSAKEVGERYGYGSPLYMQMRIFKPPLGGDGVGGIPITVIPQVSDVGATATTSTITVAATAITATATHYVSINGRTTFDGKALAFSVITTDTATTIAAKIQNVIASILTVPISAVLNVTPEQVDITTKWGGATSAGLKLAIVAEKDVGVSYAIGANVSGSGVVDISTALGTFGDTWQTIICNPYGEAQFSVLEVFNGTPDSKSGRYTPTEYRPLRAVWGSTLKLKAEILAITHDVAARLPEVTNALWLSPGSDGWDFESAANGTYLYARTNQSTPETDVAEKPYPDMPTPTGSNAIGDLSSYDNRDELSKKGASTAIIRNGKYVCLDFVTTYHPDDDPTAAYKYCRNVNIDDNYKYSHSIRQQNVVQGKALGENGANYTTPNVVKPKEWSQELSALFIDLQKRSLLVDVEFSEASKQVGINSENPDRLDDFFKIKRSGFDRINSTTVEIGFQTGNV